MKKAILVVVVIGLLVYAGIYRYQVIKNTKPVEGVDIIQKQNGIPVRVSQVTRKDLIQTITVSGQITPSKQSFVTSKISERIVSIDCQTGDKVRSGMVLVTLDSLPAQLNLDQTKVQLETSRQQLMKLQNGSRPEEIMAAKAQLDSLAADLALAEREFNRQTKLFEADTTTQKAFQDAESALARAKASYANAKAGYDLVLAGPRQEDINLAEIAVKQAELAVDIAQVFYDNHFIKAAYDGVVTRRRVDPGDLADVNMPLFELIDIDKVYLDIQISELYISTITPGMKLNFTADAYPEQVFSAIATEINPLADTADRTYTLRLTVDNPDHKLIPGMFCRSDIVVKQSVNTPTIYEDTLYRDENSDFVWVARPDAPDSNLAFAEKRTVSTGIQTRKFIEITAGLAPDEKVIEMGTFLTENAKLIIVETVEH